MDKHEQAIKEILDFVKKRDWVKFHNPKDLATALSIEASELLELFLWVKAEELGTHVKNKREDIKDELADVAVYLFELAHILDIDIFEAIKNKIKKNGEKYPVEKCMGKNKKYTEI